MSLPEISDDAVVVVLSGAGLSAASGVPTFRGFGGLWEGHRPEDLATPEAWARDSDQVRRFYEWRREGVARCQPNAGHRALVLLQSAWGARRVILVTQNVDGLLQRAAAEAGLAAEVWEMHGSLWRLKCERSDGHARVDLDPASGAWHPGPRACARCGGQLRPDVVWFGEVPLLLDEIAEAVSACDLFVSVGTSGVVYPAAGLVRIARQYGAACLEVNPEPTGGAFQYQVAEGSETALPRIVEAWLGG